jgi:RHS repeat-associated protein
VLKLASALCRRAERGGWEGGSAGWRLSPRCRRTEDRCPGGDRAQASLRTPDWVGGVPYDGNRVMKVVGSETIRYVMGLGEHSSVSGWRALYVYLGSEKLVEYRSNSTRFFHNDHLGTTKAVTDHTGLVLERWDHYPFGEEWVSGLSGDRYTWHLRDQETGHDYAGTRFYSNARGRWLSVDPVRGNMANPQRLNRYAYVLNDPVNYVDVGGGTECPALVCVTVVGAMPPDHSGYYATFYWSWRHPFAPPPTPIVPPEPPEPPQFVRDTSDFRDKLNSFVKHTLSDNCKSFLTAKGIDLGTILAAAKKTQFWSWTEYWDKPILSLPGVHGTFRGAKVLGDLWPTTRPRAGRSGTQLPWVEARVVTNAEGVFFPHVAFNPAKFVSGLQVFHELLHIALQKGDSLLAHDFGLTGLLSGTLSASEAITDFFDPRKGNCDVERMGP